MNQPKQRSFFLDMFGVIPFMYLHELGHFFTALLYRAKILEAFFVPQFRDDRFGIGLVIDYTGLSTESIFMVLISGFLITLISGALVYRYAKADWLRSIGYVWIAASFFVSYYDFYDVGLLYQSRFIITFSKIFVSALTASLIMGYGKMNQNTGSSEQL